MRWSMTEASGSAGRAHRKAVRSDERLVEQVVEPGPTTVRADAPLSETLARITNRHWHNLIVSSPDGVLLGVLHDAFARARS
jgi:CBS-domain-containing membrane protein